MDLLKRFLQANQENKKALVIHVVGDSILDENYRVEVNRISPESPNINVMDCQSEEPYQRLPGGAANVYMQLKNFNVKPRLFTLIDDAAYEYFRLAGIENWGLVLMRDGLIPRKRRFYDDTWQVGARWDIEKHNYGEKDLGPYIAQMYRLMEAHQGEPDLIIASDYNKGVFSKGCGLGQFPVAPLIVDPKKGPLEKWRYCTVFKPNAKEARELSGLDRWQDQVAFFLKELQCESVVITQAGKGVVGSSKGQNFEYYPCQQEQVYNVTGAGDCFIAIFGLATVYGFSAEEAAIIAFESGRIFVKEKNRINLSPKNYEEHWDRIHCAADNDPK